MLLKPIFSISNTNSKLQKAGAFCCPWGKNKKEKKKKTDLKTLKQTTKSRQNCRIHPKAGNKHRASQVKCLVIEKQQQLKTGE